MATRTYTTHGRESVIILAGTPAQGYSSWTVQLVTEGGVEVQIPGTNNIAGSSDDAVYVRMCEHIDTWLDGKI